MQWKTIKIDQNYKYILDRGRFEQLRATGNVAFMINKHLNDQDSSFLDSELFRRIEHRAEETTMQRSALGYGVACSVINEGKKETELIAPLKWDYNKNETALRALVT